MRHRLISPGGEKYLPFAESAIRKLLSLGLTYADQAFVIDGFTIRVRVEPGHEYIKIEGGAVTLKMDSGVVDVGFTNSNDLRRYLPGVLYKPLPVVEYDAPFTSPSKTEDLIYTAGGNSPTLTTDTPYFTNPPPSLIGQFSGEVLFGSKASGKIRRDGVAKSFVPQKVMDGSSPPKLVPNPADDSLVDKKKAAYRCPASMFTGRARLYAQAMYGQFLYSPKSELRKVSQFNPTSGEAEPVTSTAQVDVLNAPPGLLEGGGDPPALSLPLYKDPDTVRAKAFAEKVQAEIAAATAIGMHLVYQNPYNVTLNINSGVYLDLLTGKHWLINPVLGKVVFMPLVASPNGERMRRWLKGTSNLNAEDKERLEAYILGSCLPHVELRVVVSVGGVNPYASGYGWHWNWSGDTADMVQSLYDDVRNDGSALSTHHRLSVALKGTAEWSAKTTVVEGPVRWATYRGQCCFTHPSWVNRYIGSNPDADPEYWSEKGAWKFSPYAEMFPHDAPIYAFYNRDVLKVARFRTDLTIVNQRNVEFSLGYAQWINPETKDYVLSYYTAGDSGGFLTDVYENSTRKTHTITCGGASCSVSHGYVESGTGSEIHSKVAGDWPPFYHENADGFTYALYEYNFYSGGPGSNPFGTVDGLTIQHFAGPLYAGPRVFRPSTFHRDSYSYQKYPIGVAGGIIPFYDAEAFYVLQNTAIEKDKINIIREDLFGNFLSWQYGYPVVGNGWSQIGPFARTWWSPPVGGGAVYSAPDEINISDKVEFVNVVFRGSAPGLSTVPPEAMAMFDNFDEDYISGRFETRSSSSEVKPILSGLVTKDWPSGSFVRPTIVGWV